MRCPSQYPRRRQRTYRCSWKCTGSWHSKCQETWTTHAIAFAFAFDLCGASSMSSPSMEPTVAFATGFVTGYSRASGVIRDVSELKAQSLKRLLNWHRSGRGSLPSIRRLRRGSGIHPGCGFPANCRCSHRWGSPGGQGCSLSHGRCCKGPCDHGP